MFLIDAYKEAFGANGANNGLIQVLDSKKFWPGAKAYVEANGKPGLAVIVQALTDATHIKVSLDPSEGVSADGRTTRFVGTGPADLTGYTTVAVATINVPQQTVFDLPGGGVVPRIPTIF
jgi:hypothetical protein